MFVECEKCNLVRPGYNEKDTALWKLLKQIYDESGGGAGASDSASSTYEQVNLSELLRQNQQNGDSRFVPIAHCSDIHDVFHHIRNNVDQIKFQLEISDMNANPANIRTGLCLKTGTHIRSTLKYIKAVLLQPDLGKLKQILRSRLKKHEWQEIFLINYNPTCEEDQRIKNLAELNIGVRFSNNGKTMYLGTGSSEETGLGSDFGVGFGKWIVPANAETPDLAELNKAGAGAWLAYFECEKFGRDRFLTVFGGPPTRTCPQPLSWRVSDDSDGKPFRLLLKTDLIPRVEAFVEYISNWDRVRKNHQLLDFLIKEAGKIGRQTRKGNYVYEVDADNFADDFCFLMALGPAGANLLNCAWERANDDQRTRWMLRQESCKSLLVKILLGYDKSLFLQNKASRHFMLTLFRWFASKETYFAFADLFVPPDPPQHNINRNFYSTNLDYSCDVNHFNRTWVSKWVAKHCRDWSADNTNPLNCMLSLFSPEGLLNESRVPEDEEEKQGYFAAIEDVLKTDTYDSIKAGGRSRVIEKYGSMEGSRGKPNKANRTAEIEAFSQLVDIYIDEKRSNSQKHMEIHALREKILCEYYEVKSLESLKQWKGSDPPKDYFTMRYRCDELGSLDRGYRK